jgi:hypothetical protein
MEPSCAMARDCDPCAPTTPPRHLPVTERHGSMRRDPRSDFFDDHLPNLIDKPF